MLSLRGGGDDHPVKEVLDDALDEERTARQKDRR